MNLEEEWQDGMTFDRFMIEVKDNRPLWEGVYRIAKIPEWAVELACAHASHARLLVITEDWCGDASNSVPVLARLAEEANCLEVRLVNRDENLDLMDQFLTNGTRSIPIVIALDTDGEVLGHWGPRPAELQQWVMDNKGSMPREKLYPETRRWYAMDRGVSTLGEVMGMFSENASSK